MLSGFRTVKKSAAAKTAMSNCPKCGKPVYFAERKVILGKDWHASCLRCDNCDKVLTPGQHSAHQEKPYCNACYQLLFGQEGFRKGMLTSKNATPPIIVNEQSAAEKQELLSKISEYNMFKDNNVEKIKHKEINGQLLYEGVLKLYWGLKKAIKLAPGVMYAKSRNTRDSIYDFVSVDDAAYIMMLEEAQKVRAKRDLDENERKKLQMIAQGWDSKETMPRDESQEDMFSMSLPAGHYYGSDGTSSLPGTLERRRNHHERTSSLGPTPEDGVDGNAVSRSLERGTSVESNVRNSPRKRSASFRRISRQKKAEDKKDRKHYNFTPPHGQSTNLRVSNNLKTSDVLKMLMSKFKVENDVSEFALCIRYDSGSMEVCKEDDFPLQVRLKLGPSEDIAKLFVVESSEVEEALSAEAAEWVKFSVHELESFCKKFSEEEERESKKISAKFDRWKAAIKETIRTLTVEQTDV